MAEWITARAAELSNLSVFADCFPADLYPLAALLEPLRAGDGEVLMRQGETAHSFLIIATGSGLVERVNADGQTLRMTIEAGQLIGEIALLRRGPRVATVLAAGEVTGWVGRDDAFDTLIELPGVLNTLVRTARQRMAAFINPIPIHLADGTELLLRPVLPGDSARAERGAVEFSAETVFRRFMSPRELSSSLKAYLFEVDYVNHFAWVLCDLEDGMVGDVRFVRDEDDRTAAEIAFIVGDEYQGRGVGSFLMKALMLAASVAGIEKFTARVLSDNLPMRAILDKYGAKWEREDIGVVTTVIEVQEVREVRLPADLRDRIRDAARQVYGALS